MSSGMKQMVINTQERAISTDINRLQTFKGRDLGELFRYMLNVSCGTDDTESGGVVTEFETLGAPLRAEIINGLMMRPQTGTLNLTVDPGVMYALAPDASAEDSNYKFILDAGVPVPGSLVMTTNPSAFIRIDVIECEVTNSVVETDNRDIFNASTGLFTAASLTKAVKGALNYRVRAGVPGSGYPGPASGWLPLVIAHVPAGATITDTMTFWDVRPLLNDRTYPPFNMSIDQQFMEYSVINAFDATLLSGIANANLQIGFGSSSGMGARRVGGRLRSSAPGVADSDIVDITAATNRDGWGAVANTPYYLYLACPYGLPRWARYTATGTRVPRSPRGLLVLTGIPPSNNNGAPGTPLPMPTTWGLGTSSATTEAICVASGYWNSAANFGGFWSEGGRHMLTNATLPPDAANPIVKSPNFFAAAGGSATARYDCIPGVHWPTHAKEVLLEFSADLDMTAGGRSLMQFLRLYEPNSTTQPISNTNMANSPGVQQVISLAGSATGNAWASAWVTLPNPYLYTSYGLQRIEVYYFSFGFITGVTAGGARMRILGWKI